ncbi:MAG TPA: IS110 family transposase [Candidatus Saccharimonadales bacterium]|nr:IS110 family transposase [Candidatus Saccharimonadales bacterium]
MTAIGIDTHKATLAACAVDDLGRPIKEATFANDPPGHVAFIAWARAIASDVTIGIEGSSSFGGPLAWSVERAGLAVREVPPHLSRAERGRTRRPGKSDPGDALAIARVTARETNLPPIRLPDRTTELRLLLEAREDLVAETTRARNRLHAHLLALVPGYGAKVANLVAARNRTTIGRLLRGNPTVQAELARGLIVRLTRLERESSALAARIGRLVAGHPLLALPGAGPITVARLIAEVGDVRRFRSADALAALAGVAPIPASSGQIQRMRLNRGGNRQLNRALYVIAVSQSRFYAPAMAYMARRMETDGKTWREAIRALKRLLVRPVFRLLVEGSIVSAEAA